MVGWAFRALDRWVRGSPMRAAGLLNRVPAGVVRGLAREKLVRTLRHVWDRSPAQRERWQAAGVRRSDLRSPRILARIPFTTGDDLAARGGDFLCAPTDELVHVLTTSGTKGRHKNIYLTRDDFATALWAIGVSYRLLSGATRGIAIFDATYPTWSAGPIARRGFEAAGMFALLSSPGEPLGVHLDLIREHRIDMMVTTPTFAHRLTREADRDLRPLGVRWIVLSGQPWTEALRRELESAWGARALDAYASTEFVCGIAEECPEQNGLHIDEADLWPEVVEPSTGRALADGEEGELVLTTLSRRGMPLVRYRTGDYARLLPREGRCACGSPLRRMSRVRGRVDDMVIVGAANNVLPDEFDRAILALPGVTDYQVVLEKADGFRDVLRVTVEAAEGAAPPRDMVERALLGISNVGHSCTVERTLDIGPVEVARPGTLSAGRPKTNRIIDRRQMT